MTYIRTKQKLIGYRCISCPNVFSCHKNDTNYVVFAVSELFPCKLSSELTISINLHDKNKKSLSFPSEKTTWLKKTKTWKFFVGDKPSL